MMMIMKIILLIVYPFSIMYFFPYYTLKKEI